MLFSEALVSTTVSRPQARRAPCFLSDQERRETCALPASSLGLAASLRENCPARSWDRAAATRRLPPGSPTVVPWCGNNGPVLWMNTVGAVCVDSRQAGACACSRINRILSWPGSSAFLPGTGARGGQSEGARWEVKQPPSHTQLLLALEGGRGCVRSCRGSCWCSPSLLQGCHSLFFCRKWPLGTFRKTKDAS